MNNAQHPTASLLALCNTMLAPRLMTAVQIGKKYNCDRNTPYYQMKKGNLTAFNIAGSLFFDIEEVEKVFGGRNYA